MVFVTSFCSFVSFFDVLQNWKGTVMSPEKYMTFVFEFISDLLHTLHYCCHLGHDASVQSCIYSSLCVCNLEPTLCNIWWPLLHWQGKSIPSCSLQHLCDYSFRPPIRRLCLLFEVASCFLLLLLFLFSFYLLIFLESFTLPLCEIVVSQLEKNVLVKPVLHLGTVCW